MYRYFFVLFFSLFAVLPASATVLNIQITSSTNDGVFVSDAETFSEAVLNTSCTLMDYDNPDGSSVRTQDQQPGETPTTYEVKRYLMSFDTSQIPTGATINSVQIRVNLKAYTYLDGTGFYFVNANTPNKQNFSCSDYDQTYWGNSENALATITYGELDMYGTNFTNYIRSIATSTLNLLGFTQIGIRNSMDASWGLAGQEGVPADNNDLDVNTSYGSYPNLAPVLIIDYSGGEVPTSTPPSSEVLERISKDVSYLVIIAFVSVFLLLVDLIRRLFAFNSR